MSNPLIGVIFILALAGIGIFFFHGLSKQQELQNYLYCEASRLYTMNYYMSSIQSDTKDQHLCPNDSCIQYFQSRIDAQTKVLVEFANSTKHLCEEKHQ